MKLSELMPLYLPQYRFELKGEREFESLGLIGSKSGTSKCTFVLNEDYVEQLPDDVSIVITNKEIAESVIKRNIGVCIVENPQITFFRLHNALAKLPSYNRMRFKTTVGKNCKIHETVIIPEHNVVIGDNVKICEYVVVRENVIVGNDTIIRTGVKIGDPDYEFKFENGEIFAVQHCGGVKIGDNVEILPNSVINRSVYPWDDTVIANGCKIDTLCLIAHGVKVGENTMIIGHSNIGGRVEIGKNCWIGLSATLRNGIKVGDGARINMGAVVTKDVGGGQSVTGNFAINHEDFITSLKGMGKSTVL